VFQFRKNVFIALVTGLERRIEPIKSVRRPHDAKESGVALWLVS
jgi:hypothetical protein